MWEIKGKNNQTKTTVYALEYNGIWMGECYVTATIESPTPIDFAIGDYLMYRGERFEINYDPGKIKSAPQFTKGDAFKYESVKFNSLSDELTRCDFLDVVLGDNQLHFTGLPKFSFYGGVQDLANRIQANLNRVYPNQWTVVVSPEYSSKKELNVSVDTQKVWDALSTLVNDFETYFTIKGRTITIGAVGIPAGHLFKYGKGNGLYEIEQNAEADQAIVTRLRAYGSTRNLPHRYYNSLTGADGQKLIPDNMAVQHLMLPDFPYITQDPYIDSANKAALGIREGTIFFDGSQEGLEEIYPSIEGMTAEDLRKAGVPCNSTGALDEIVSAEQMTDNGVGEINEGSNNTNATPPTFKVALKDLGFDINEHRTTEAATLSFKTGMLGGRDFEIVGCKSIKATGNKVTGYELELNRVYNNDIKLWFPYKDYNAKAGDKFVLLHIKMPEVYIKAAAIRLKKAAEAWLAKNDYSRSVYAPKVDEIFMARQHDEAMASGGSIASLHDTLKEGMLLLFEDEDLNIDASIFIDRLSIKEGNGTAPTYEVVLKEEKTVGRLDKMQNQIDSLAAGKGQGSNGGYTAAQIRQLIDAYGGTRFLSKIKDDRTPHKVSTDKAFEVGEYLAGVSGGILGKDSNGDSFAEVARLFVRVKAFFEELTVIKSGVIAGKNYITPGGGITCTKVDENASAYRCYFLCEQDGEKTETKFIVNDQAISQTFNAKTGTSNKIDNHRYWRLVTAVNNDAYTDDAGNHYGYIDLSKSICEAGSSIPKAGDEICQLGYQGTDNPERQTAMVFSTVDADAPSIKMFSDINSFSLDGKAIISFGRDPITGQVFFRLGASGAKQYLEYTQANGLEIAGKISNLSTIGNTTIGDYITETANDLLQVEYSQTGADNTWHKVWQETDKYMRQSKDGGKTWTGAMLISGKDGDPGPQGVPGPPGTTYYTWIRYADDAYGNGISNDPTGKPYIGLAYNKTTPVESNTPSDYTWSQVQGEPGVPGAPGKNGETYWTWIKYSDNADGTGMYDIPNDSTKYIGIAVNKPTQTESNNKADYTWSRFRGKDGTSVTTTSTEVRYSTEHTASQPTDNTFTLTNVPTLGQGQYLWSRTRVTYSDGNGTTTYGVSRNGLNGINGANGRGVLNTAITYQLGDSGTVAPTGTWSTNVPTLTKGKYLWTRSVTTYTSGDPTTLYSVSYIAKDGNNGKDGLPGKDGAGIVSTTITYAKSTSYANPPASGWQTAIPNVPEGQYLWTRTVWEYSDGDSETGYSVARQGADGESVTITSTEVRYAKGDYPTQPADTAFTLTSVGTLTKGQWLWTRTTVYYSDGAQPKSYTAAYIGSDGIQGIPGTPGEDGKTPYLHFAYAAGITGSLPHPTAVTGFSTTSFVGAKYIGVCTDYNEDDPTTDVGATYEWSKYRGADGSSFANNMLWNSNFQNGRKDWDDWGGGSTSRILVTEDDKKWVKIITRGDSSQGISQGDTRKVYAQEKTYTVSALVRSNTAGQHINLNIHCVSSSGVNLVGIDKRFDVGTTPQRVSATFKAVAGTARLRLMVGAATTDPIDVYVTDLKIEEGENNNTQWTPNPEEMIGKDAPYTVFQWAIGDFTQPTGTWSNHPLNPKPGEAVWMRQGTVTPPSTTPVWDTSNYMRVTGTAGQSGSDVYLLDIDNEVIAVACDSGGNPLLGQFPVKATARVYKGGTEVTSGVAFSSEYNPEVSATLSGGDITIGGLYADTATLTITATVAGLTLYSTIRLYKVKPGANGAPAVVYSIEPSVNVVTKSLTTGLSTKQLTCTKYKTTGAAARTATKENTLKATIYTNGMAGTEQVIANALKDTGTVALTNDTTGVAFALYNSSGVELDREFVPVISDASGLQIGGTNLLRKTNQGTENWMTSTSAKAEINLSPADDAQGVVLTNMATGAVLSSGWQMIGFRLPPSILKKQRYYTLSFTAKADALMTVSGRVQISGSTGGDLLTNILSFNFSPDETRHTFLLKTNSTAQTNAQSLWCYLFCNAKWNTIEIRDLKLEEGTVATEWSPAPQDFNYITSALQESGRSEGGLILASLLRLGYTVEDGEYRVMSGINGIANPAAENRDIAIWTGGEMRDATDPENSDYDDNAAYAMRHNGNGYACQGNVRFIGGRILIGKNRDVTGKIKSDSDFAKNCVALDGEGLTLYKNGVERLIVADRSVGTDFISKEEITNWSYAVRNPQELLFKQYHTHTEGFMSPDGEIITLPIDSYDWFATGKVTEILNISPGATAYPNRIIPVGEVLNVSNFTTHVTNTAFTGQYVHLTAALQLCYDDSSGKRVVVATAKSSFVRNSATPSRWQATISLGKHTVQVAAAYYLNVVVNTTTPTHGKETGTSVSSKVNMSASGDVRKSNDNVTIIGIDGMVSLWGNGGILINSNGAMIKGSLKVNGKNVQTIS